MLLVAGKTRNVVLSSGKGLLMQHSLERATTAALGFFPSLRSCPMITSPNPNSHLLKYLLQNPIKMNLRITFPACEFLGDILKP